jgi:hypothetical protein
MKSKSSWDKKLDDESKPEFNLEVLYQEVLADIRFAKNQQWLITTYAVGIYVFLISLFDKLLGNLDKSLNPISPFRALSSLFLVLVIILVIFIIIKGCRLIDIYHIDIINSRDRKKRIIDKYPNLDETLKPPGIEKKDKIVKLLKGVIISVGIIEIVYIIEQSLFLCNGLMN